MTFVYIYRVMFLEFLRAGIHTGNKMFCMPQGKIESRPLVVFLFVMAQVSGSTFILLLRICGQDAI